MSPKPAYSIIDVDVKDPALFEEYLKGYVPTAEKFGGRFLVAPGGGPHEVITGDWTPRNLFIVRWPSKEAYHRWQASEDYRPWKELRRRAARPNVVLVEGLPD